MKYKFLGGLALAVGLSVAITAGSGQAAGAACVDYNYRYGSRGTCVKYLQTLANQYGSTSLRADGIFGVQTDSAIRKTQSSWGLVSDGIVGYRTWGLLCTVQAGWIDEYGRSHMLVPDNWPLSTAKAAGCSKYWKGAIVAGVQY